MPPDPPPPSFCVSCLRHSSLSLSSQHYTYSQLCPTRGKNRRRPWDLALNPLLFADYICPFSKKLGRHNSIQKKDDKMGKKTHWKNQTFQTDYKMPRSCKFIRGQIFPYFRLIKKKGRGKKRAKKKYRTRFAKQSKFGF